MFDQLFDALVTAPDVSLNDLVVQLLSFNFTPELISYINEFEDINLAYNAFEQVHQIASGLRSTPSLVLLQTNIQKIPPLRLSRYL